jgi:hypothetical protein
MTGRTSHLIQNILWGSCEAIKYDTPGEFHPNFDQVLVEGMEQAMLQVAETLTNNTQPTFKLKYGLSADLDCPDLIEVEMVANVTIGGVKKKKGKKRAKRVVRRNTELKEVKLPFIAIPTDVKFRIPPNSSFFVRRMINSFEERRNREKTCHEVETFIIETRDRAEFDSEMASVTTEQERADIIAEMDKARVGIDCTNLVNKSALDFEKKLEKLRGKFEKPLLRYEELQKRPNALRKLQVALTRAAEARLKPLNDEDTVQKFDKYIQETNDKLKKLENDGPLDKPSFLVEDIKEREKEILNKIAEIRRPPKKKEVVNFSTENQSDMDEDEMERLRNVGIVLGKGNKKKKSVKDLDPAVRAEKEAALKELQDKFDDLRRAFNRTRDAFCDERHRFEERYFLAREPCEYNNGSYERSRFLREERYDAHLERKQKRKEARELARLLMEEEMKKPTPIPSPEELERMRIEKEKADAKRQAEEERRKLLENERWQFRTEGSGMYDEDELNKQNEDALYAKYKELKKKHDKPNFRPFKTDAERADYEDERREYEALRRKFEFDPVRRKEEAKKKKAAKKKKEAKEAKNSNRTELDDKISDVEADLRQLERDNRWLEEDMHDFFMLKKVVERRVAHDDRKMKRFNKRDLLERKKRAEEWGEEGDFRELEKYADVDLDGESSFYAEEEEEPPKKPNIDAELADEEEEVESTSSSSEDDTSSDHDPHKDTNEKIEDRRRIRAEIREKISKYFQDGVRVRAKRTEKRTPQELYHLRFQRINQDEEHFRSRKKKKQDLEKVNPDDSAPAEPKHVEEDELGEDEEYL